MTKCIGKNELMCPKSYCYSCILRVAAARSTTNVMGNYSLCVRVCYLLDHVFYHNIGWTRQSPSSEETKPDRHQSCFSPPANTIARPQREPFKKKMRWNHDASTVAASRSKVTCLRQRYWKALFRNCYPVPV